MSTTVLLAAGMLLVAVPSASGQRGGRGAVGGARGGGQGRTMAGVVGDPSPALSAADVARVDPIAMLLERRTTLGIADSQATRLAVIHTQLIQHNAPHLRALDSALAVIRHHATDTSGTVGDRLMRTGDDRATFTAILGRIRDNDDAAADQAMAIFTGSQLRRVYNVVREQRTIMSAVVRGGAVPPPAVPRASSGA